MGLDRNEIISLCLLGLNIWLMLMIIDRDYLIKKLRNKDNEKWYGKFGYSSEGILDYIETDNKSIAEAYVRGINRAVEELECGGDNPLEDYWTSVDQIEPIDEEGK